MADKQNITGGDGTVIPLRRLRRPQLSRRMISVLALLALLLTAQALSTGLNLAAFKKLHLNAVISACDAVGAEMAAKINRALKLGKPLDNFIGMEKILCQGRQGINDVGAVGIVNADGQVLYRCGNLPDTMTPVADSDHGNNGSSHLELGRNHYLLFPLRQHGHLLLRLDSRTLQAEQQSIIDAALTISAITTAAAALLLTLGFFIIFNRPALQRKRTVYLFLFVILGAAQLVCSYSNTRLFQNHYRHIVHTKAATVATLLKRDIATYLHYGLDIRALVNIDHHMAATVARADEIAALDILAPNGTRLYHAGSTAAAPPQLVSFLPIKVDGRTVGTIKIILDGAVLSAAVNAIALDSLTIVVLLLLFVVEMMVMLYATLLTELDRAGDRSGYGGSLIRPATFFYVFAAALCYSFIPLYMRQIYQPIAGLSRQVVLSLPVSVEMLAGGIILIPVGHWIDRRGWHQPFIVGTIISIAGATASALALHPLAFIAARAFTGSGYGMVWMSAQGFVLSQAHPRRRARAFSNLVAGIFSGIICGNAVGALLAQQLGFRPVFMVAAAICAASLLFTLIFMRDHFIRPHQCDNDHTDGGAALSALLRDRRAMTMFTCSLMPYSIAMAGLLYYVSPLYLHQLGSSQSTIGRVIMLFGLSMIFIAPQISARADRVGDKRPFVYGGGFLAAASLLLFLLGNSFWIVPAAVTLFGISVGASGASRNLLMASLPVSRRVGVNRVMGVYRSLDKVSQALGPLLFALLLGVMDIPHAMVSVGAAYLLLTLVVMWGWRNDKKQPIK